MKHIICFILLLYEGFSLFSQTQTIIFKPDSIDGYDATIHNVVAPNHLNEMYCIYAQPSGYYYAYARALIKFQQINTQIPTNAIILNARLRLFGVDSYWGYGWGNSCYPGYNYPYYANASWIEKITQSWSRTGVNWYNQPATTTENHIEIPNSATQWNWNFADSSQSLVNMVQSWVSTPASNYGFMIKLQSETADKALHFATSYYPNELYRPELEITYTVEPCDIAAELPPEINVCEGDTIKLWNLVADSGSCQWSYMNADGNWANSTDDTLIFVANYSQTVGLIFSKHVYCDTMVSVNINVQPLPAIVFIGDDAVCLGSSITLTATTDTEGCDFLWNTGETSSAITVSPNVPTTYRVTVTSQPLGCKDSAEHSVNINNPQVDAGQDISICEGETAEIHISGVANTFYWSSSPQDESITHINDTAISVSPQVNTTYIIRGEITMNCFDTDTVTVSVNPNPIAQIDAEPSTIDYLNPIVQFTDNSIGNAFRLWQLSDGSTYTSSTFQHTFDALQNYYEVSLLTTSSAGCIDSTKIRLDVMRDHFLFAPTGVCPTEINLQNTGFRVYVANIQTFELTIYNRYGQVVWQTNDPEATWDCRYKGSYVPTGEYIWRAKYTYQDSPNDKQESAGTFFIYF